MHLHPIDLCLEVVNLSSAFLIILDQSIEKSRLLFASSLARFQLVSSSYQFLLGSFMRSKQLVPVCYLSIKQTTPLIRFLFQSTHLRPRV